MLVILVALLTVVASNARNMRVLAIGNSFSMDAVEQYLWELAAEQGDTLIIGNAYIGGCSIDRHLNNLLDDVPDYVYNKVVEGEKTSRDSLDLVTIIADEPWDFISLQQASKLSGKPESYGNLWMLRVLVTEQATNPEMRLIWHLTWAYASEFRGAQFADYGNDQQRMYHDILTTYFSTVRPEGFDRYVPVGIAVQNARARVGEQLNRDGLHLSVPFGRYVAACTWCEFLTGKSVVGLKYVPEGIDAADAKAAQLAAHEAILATFWPTDRLLNR